MPACLSLGVLGGLAIACLVRAPTWTPGGVVPFPPPPFDALEWATTTTPIVAEANASSGGGGDREASPLADLQTPFVGVNLGGWLLLEEWMWAQEMDSKGIPDEYTLIQRHGGPRDPRAISLMRMHWETFVTEDDLDLLARFGVTCVRVPIGWWLVDYDPADGFVDGGEWYLSRLLGWLQQRGLRAVIDLHAVPGAQVEGQGFTGKMSGVAGFFKKENFRRGKVAMTKLARLILQYEAHPLTAGVVVGMELVNEPSWGHWATSPGIRELYAEMVPRLRRLLPARRYLLLLNFMDSPRTEGAAWLALKRAEDPDNFEGVVYDAHIYHAYGDDKEPWESEQDSCKSCCRDAVLLAPVSDAGLPLVVGEYSLNTGFAGYPEFWSEYLENQLSVWANAPGVLGSFFWNHRILRKKGGWYKEFSLLELVAPAGTLPSVAEMNLSSICPSRDLALCPHFQSNTTVWTEACVWQRAP